MSGTARRSRRSGERGFASLQFVMAATLAMLMVVGLVQFVAYQYARGALMAALERGVRAGALSGSGADECQAAVADSLSEVLGGTIGGTLAYGCEAHDEQVRAWATGIVPAWIPTSVDLTFDLETTARRETEP